MPSSSRPTRSFAWIDMAACSRACAALASFGPPRHTASHERPPESTSRLAHWCASSTGWRWTNVAMQPTPRRARVVTPASVPRSATDSSRGLASRLSPTQIVSKAPEPSPAVARSMRSRTVTAPSTTARFGRMRPSDGVVTGILLSAMVADLERRAALGRTPRAVRHARRAARVHAGRERLAERDVVKGALHDPHLFPEVVALDAHGRGIAPRLEVQAPRVVAGRLVAAQDALEKARHARHAFSRQVRHVEELHLGFWHRDVSSEGGRRSGQLACASGRRRA